MERLLCPIMKTECETRNCALWDNAEKACALLSLTKCTCRCDK